MRRLLLVSLNATTGVLFASCVVLGTMGAMGWTFQIGPRSVATNAPGAAGPSRLWYVNGNGVSWFASDASDERHSVLPTWSVVILTSLTWVARRWLAAERYEVYRESKSCPACGYDLRATPGRCPECGHGA